VFVAIPSQVTIGETEITASKIWANQELSNYPAISLNISNDGIRYLEDVTDGVLYYQATLTIHILTQNSDGLNGGRIADELSQAIITETESWTTPLSGDIRIFNPETDIKSVQPVYSDYVFDYIISVDIYHS
jgi:hypothetical protein